MEKQYFKKEQEVLNTIINSLIDKKNKYINNNYNEDICENYSIVEESSLKNYLKLEIDGTNLIFIPHADKVMIKSKLFKREDLCKEISNQYQIVLKLLVMIKNVYDLDHYGSNSIAGICFKNVRIVGKIIEINYCAVKQMDFDVNAMNSSNSSNSKKHLNFKRVAGISDLYDNFLTLKEKNIFSLTLMNLFKKKSMKKMGSVLSCGDEFISNKEYGELHPKIKEGKCDKLLKDKHNKVVMSSEYLPEFEVKANAPIFSMNSCLSRARYLITIDESKPIKELLNKYNKVRTDYAKSINKIVEIINKLVYKKNGKYALYNIESSTLELIIQKIKRELALFYQQSIINYYSLLEFAKTLPHITLDWQTSLDDAVKIKQTKRL